MPSCLSEQYTQIAMAHPSSTKLRQDLDQRKKEERNRSSTTITFPQTAGLATTFRGEALFPLFLSLPTSPSLNLHRYACLHHAVLPFSPVTINTHRPHPPHNHSASPTPRAAPAVALQRIGPGRCLPVAQLMPCAKCMWYQ